MPDDETLDDLGIESPWDLTGLYHGTPLTERSVSDIARPKPGLAPVVTTARVPS